MFASSGASVYKDRLAAGEAVRTKLLKEFPMASIHIGQSLRPVVQRIYELMGNHGNTGADNMTVLQTVLDVGDPSVRQMLQTERAAGTRPVPFDANTVVIRRFAIYNNTALYEYANSDDGIPKGLKSDAQFAVSQLALQVMLAWLVLISEQGMPFGGWQAKKAALEPQKANEGLNALLEKVERNLAFEQIFNQVEAGLDYVAPTAAAVFAATIERLHLRANSAISAWIEKECFSIDAAGTYAMKSEPRVRALIAEHSSNKSNKKEIVSIGRGAGTDNNNSNNTPSSTVAAVERPRSERGCWWCMGPHAQYNCKFKAHNPQIVICLNCFGEGHAKASCDKPEGSKSVAWQAGSTLARRFAELGQVSEVCAVFAKVCWMDANPENLPVTIAAGNQSLMAEKSSGTSLPINTKKVCNDGLRVHPPPPSTEKIKPIRNKHKKRSPGRRSRRAAKQALARAQKDAEEALVSTAMLAASADRESAERLRGEAAEVGRDARLAMTYKLAAVNVAGDGKISIAEHMENDKRCYLDSSLGGRDVRLLGDSGAEVSCVSDKVLAEIAKTSKNQITVAESYERIVGADGSPLVVAGIASLSVVCRRKNSPRCVKFAFFVVNDLPYDAIAGVDLMRALGNGLVTFDFINQTISFDEAKERSSDRMKQDEGAAEREHELLEAAGVASYSTERKNGWVIAEETVVIEPRRERVLNARILGSFARGTTLMVEDRADMTSEIERQFAVCAAIVMSDANPTKPGAIIVRLVNLTDEPLHINFSEHIALAGVMFENRKARRQKRRANGMAALTARDFERSPRPTVQTVASDEDLTKAVGDDVLDDAQRQQLVNLLIKFRDKGTIAFGKRPLLGKVKGVEMRIETGEAQPERVRPYRRSPMESAYIKEVVSEMYEDGVVSRSNSPWAAPIVLARKPHGAGVRFCVDYRRLNQVTKVDSYPSPFADDNIDAVGKARFVSTLDMNAGFWQVGIHSDDREKTAFSTPDGLFEFNRMPFGLVAAPAVFQRVMDTVLNSAGPVNARAYIDDVVVFSETFEQHLEDVEQVLKCLDDFEMTVRLEKCNFCRKEMALLGHIIVPGVGVKPDPQKVQAVRDLAPPTSVTHVKSFLGIVGYYRRFVRNFARMAGPLNALTRKSIEWQWGETEQAAFESLRNTLGSSEVLHIPDFDLPFKVRIDASKSGLGATLLNVRENGEEVPIAFASWSLSATELNWKYGVPELEALTLVKALRRWRPYLFGQRFSVVTDHFAHKWLQTAQLQNSRIQRWAVEIQGYNFDIEHNPGKTMGDVDGFSRMPFNKAHGQEKQRNKRGGPDYDRTYYAPRGDGEDGSDEDEFPVLPENEKPGDEEDNGIAAVRRLSNGSASVLGRTQGTEDHGPPIAEAQQADTEIQAAIARAATREGGMWRGKLETQADGIVRWQDKGGHWRTVVPKPLRDEIMLAAHDGVLGGHLGFKKTVAKVCESYFWPKMRAQIERYIQTCSECAARKGSKVKEGLLQPIRVQYVRQRMGIDLLGPLPESGRGNKWILTCVDHLSKWAEWIPLRTATAGEIAVALNERVFMQRGAPDQIVSDRGANLWAEIVEELNDLFGTKRSATTAYNPQVNGLTEKANGTIAAMLSNYVQENQRNWDEYLAYNQFAYNTAKHASTGETPFAMEHGREARLPSHTSSGVAAPEVLQADRKEYFRTGFRMFQEQAAALNAQAQDVAKAAYDKGRSAVAFEVGERVWVYTPAVRPGTVKKLQRFWKGPYRITKVMGPNTYEVCHWGNQRVSQLVPARRLRRQEARAVGELGAPSPSLSEDEEEFELERIISMEITNGEKLYKVRWKNLSPSYDGWVTADDLVNATEAMADYEKRLQAEARVPTEEELAEGALESLAENQQAEREAAASDFPSFEALRGRKVTKDGGGVEYLVKWSNRIVDTWENKNSLLASGAVTEAVLVEFDRSMARSGRATRHAARS